MNAILRFSALGDIAALLPVLRALDEKPTIITSKIGYELLKDEFDDFIILNSKSWIDVIKIIIKIKSKKFKNIIDFQRKDRTKFILKFINANKYPKVNVKYNTNATNLFFKIAQQSNLVDLLDETPKNIKKNYIVINAGSSPAWLSKRLPLNKWDEIVQYIYNKYKLKIILTGDKSEIEYVEQIKNNNINITIENMAGKTTIQQLKEILNNAYLTISTDSAAMHISAVMKTPTIGIFGPTNWIKSAPFGPWSRVVYDKTYFKEGKPLAKNSREIDNYFDNIDITEALDSLSEYLK